MKNTDPQQARVEKISARRMVSLPTTAPGAKLPEGMLEGLPKRLAASALLYAIGYTTSILADHLVEAIIGPADAKPPDSMVDAHVTCAIFVLLSLAVAAVARWSKLTPRVLHALGIVYMVVGSFGIGLGVTAFPMTDEVRPWGISWVCVWIVICPLMVPTTPRQATQVALASALAGSLAVFFWVLFFGFPVPSAHALTGMWIPNFICALLASLEAGVLYRLGRDLEKAKRMGSYELVELLGRGGMGEVWRAHHRMLARPAAIKLVRAEFLGDPGQAAQALRRFEREAQATAQLTSPHSVELYDFGLTRDGQFYYVMEFLDGLDLETLVQRFGPMPAERAVHFLLQVCHSLADAHHYGLIHRDVKPANIYTCRMGLDHDFVKVLDFGLVKRSQADAGETRLTAETVMTGTPAYMSPEAALGLELDARADLYSLGCVGYWLLTGKLVFEGTTSMEMLVHHAKTPPTPPSRRTEILVPPELDAIILWCLAKEADERPAGASELAARLEAIPHAEPWNSQRARLWWQAHVPTHPAGERGEVAPAARQPAGPSAQRLIAVPERGPDFERSPARGVTKPGSQAAPAGQTTPVERVVVQRAGEEAGHP